jgi:hypothetical protein
MDFDICKSIEILERTPGTLKSMLEGISEEWIFSNEGGDSWSPYDILGHLIHGEKTDWIVRMKIILSVKGTKKFEPYDRFAQFQNEKRSINELLGDFARLRRENMNILKSAAPDKTMLSLKGIHPEFGEVDLEQLLATWVVHDLGHIAQTARVMARQYKKAVGPWTAYLTILNGQKA